MPGDVVLVLALAGSWAGAGMAIVFLRQRRRVLARRLAILALTVALLLPVLSTVAVLLATFHEHGDTGSHVELEANRSALFHQALYDGVFLGLLGLPPLIVGIVVMRRSRIQAP